ncbi:hypothetical protein DPSP01_005850 [Paraphaeosphaeria sporulosa]
MQLRLRKSNPAHTHTGKHQLHGVSQEYEPVCVAPPRFTGLVARNRFERDYERCARYFNKNHSLVAKACRKRFKKVTKKGKIPKRYDDCARKEKKKKCGKKADKTHPGDAYSHSGKGQKNVSKELPVLM